MIDNIDVVVDRIVTSLKYTRNWWIFGTEKRMPNRHEVKTFLKKMESECQVGDIITSGGICMQRCDENHTDIYVYIGDLGPA